MKTPGPDHPITLTAAPRRWRATYYGVVIADTADALVLQEAAYAPVVYFPRADVDMAQLSRTKRSTHCPYKGDASYYTLLINGHVAENAVWTYEAPYPAMSLIDGRLAFYTDRIEVQEIVGTEADGPQSARVADVILHTDSGSGTAQREHWAPNVGTPPRDDGGAP